MDPKVDQLETAFREFVELESEHVSELQAQVSEVRKEGVAMQGPLSSATQAVETQAARVLEVEERLSSMDARVTALQRLYQASGGMGEQVGVGLVGTSNEKQHDNNTASSNEHSKVRL